MASNADLQTFLKQRKREYSVQFPFLTDSQVVAKLKRIWNATKSTTKASKTNKIVVRANNCQPLTIDPTLRHKRKPRAIVRGSLPSLASESFQATKENIVATHSKDINIPTCTSTTNAVDTKNLNLACGHKISQDTVKNEQYTNLCSSLKNRCEPPKTTLTPHTHSDNSLPLHSGASMSKEHAYPLCSDTNTPVSDSTGKHINKLYPTKDGIETVYNCLAGSVSLSNDSPVVESETCHPGNFQHTADNLVPSHVHSFECKQNGWPLSSQPCRNEVYGDSECCVMLGLGQSTTESNTQAKSGKMFKSERTQAQNSDITNSQPSSVLKDNSSALNTSTTSLPSDLPHSHSRSHKNNQTIDIFLPVRVTRSRAAQLKQAGLYDEVFTELPTKKRRIAKKDNKVCCNSEKSEQSTVSADQKTPNGKPACRISETATVPYSEKTPLIEGGCSETTPLSCKVKSSSPFQPFAECSTTPSPSAKELNCLSPVRKDVLCDMFLPLTPERQEYDFFQSSFYSKPATERRVFRSAASLRAMQSEVTNYCMFDDESDIFM